MVICYWILVIEEGGAKRLCRSALSDPSSLYRATPGQISAFKATKAVRMALDVPGGLQRGERSSTTRTAKSGPPERTAFCEGRWDLFVS